MYRNKIVIKFSQCVEQQCLTICDAHANNRYCSSLYNNYYHCCAYLVAGVSIPVIASVVVIVVMVIGTKIVIVALIIICSRRKSDRLSEWNSTCTGP